jgi:DNA-binding response OmpR family regulator
MYMITEEEPSYHLRALYRRLSARPYRILYVGLDHALLDYLQERLDDCWIVRAPAGHVARPFIDKLNYSLLLFDEDLVDTTGLALARFTRELPHRQCTPIIVTKKSDEFESLSRAISRRLTTPP